jgi:hypothetical protein
VIEEEEFTSSEGSELRYREARLVK